MTTTIQSAATTLREPGVEFEFDEAQLAAVSFRVDRDHRERSLRTRARRLCA
jgi:hypothetical protein